MNTTCSKPNHVEGYNAPPEEKEGVVGGTVVPLHTCSRAICEGSARGHAREKRKRVVGETYGFPTPPGRVNIVTNKRHNKSSLN